MSKKPIEQDTPRYSSTQHGSYNKDIHVSKIMLERHAVKVNEKDLIDTTKELEIKKSPSFWDKFWDWATK